MSKGRILVVEDDFDISNMLKIYFSGQGYEVQVAPRGSEALSLTRKQLPQLIVLDIMLPDMNGYDVCRDLRSTTRTSHIPIIFLTQKDERSDKIAGLELGADDYITKPFDIEELKLRVKNQIERSERDNTTDPNSGLPSSLLIEDKLRDLMRDERTWSYLDLRMTSYEAFKDVYGFVAGNEVLRFMALLIGEVLDALGTPDDFVGHAGGDNFVIISYSPRSEALAERLTARFAEDIQQHYSFIDRERGFMMKENEKVPLMTLAVGVVSNASRKFADIREITELAAESRRRGSTNDIAPIATEW
ncbi:MAG TPA: response regulator [Aggregatilinea sp.]|jgi:DNA-binding response OmpR family regulator|uniref:response regulator n=1 Tax=Aggregatilinea sp. TaxID=2806333 RepID=UPI002C507D95|nr:response regulator [Aggregatilinea sp.]HML23397.1 response regulator [Aggregatilinea sp.]